MFSRETFKKAEKGRKSHENILQNDLEQGRGSEQHPQAHQRSATRLNGGWEGILLLGKRDPGYHRQRMYLPAAA